jgi:hypothetical protein
MPAVEASVSTLIFSLKWVRMCSSAVKLLIAEHRGIHTPGFIP